MPAQNIGNLDGGPVGAAVGADHHPHPAADHRGGVTSSDRRSSGLCVARIVSVATCMIRISVPFSRRCVAKLWRSVWSVTRLVRPAAFTADRQAACNTV